MRELKFRAWDVEDKYYFDISSIEFIPKIIAYDLSEAGRNSVIEQFTGLKDKNGKEIYEGDIVKVCDWGIKTSNNVIGVGVIEWDTDKKGWSYNPGFQIDEYDMFRNVEVIGNIHENPDLIGARHE